MTTGERFRDRVGDAAATAFCAAWQLRTGVVQSLHLIHPKIDARRALRATDPKKARYAAQRALDMLKVRQAFPLVPIPGEEAMEIRDAMNKILERPTE